MSILDCISRLHTSTKITIIVCAVVLSLTAAVLSILMLFPIEPDLPQSTESERTAETTQSETLSPMPEITFH